MGSSHGLITCEMIAKGLSYESGSLQDKFARIHLENERRVSYLTTLTVVNAIVETGNRIVAAITQSPTNQLNGDNLKKCMDSLKDLLVPQDGEQKARQAARAKKRLEEEMNKGPIKVQAMSHPRPRKKQR